VASHVQLTASVTCSAGCNLSGGRISLISGEHILDSGSLIANEKAQFLIQAPAKLGSYRWRLFFAGDDFHEQASLTLTFATTPIITSMAVWDISSPVIVGERFKIKVGVKSSHGSALTGALVEILDSNGECKGVGKLGALPWEGTAALYWAEFEVTAPSEDGPTRWSAKFGANENGLAHDEAVLPFTFVAVNPPDHKLTIVILDKETEAPIQEAHVRLGYFRAVTDADGRADLAMPGGKHEVQAWMVSHELAPTVIDVKEDMTIRLKATAIPEEDPGARWSM